MNDIRYRMTWRLVSREDGTVEGKYMNAPEEGLDEMMRIFMEQEFKPYKDTHFIADLTIVGVNLVTKWD